jgi:ribose transport system permease protein
VKAPPKDNTPPFGGLASAEAIVSARGRSFAGSFSRGHLTLVMPYIYVLVLGTTILILEPRLIVGPGALDANFMLIVPLATVAFGQTLVMMTRGIDLSVGGVISLVSALMATHLNANGALIVVELTALICLGILVGTLNGVIICYTGLQPFIVTLATWSICDGVAFAILPVEGGKPSSQLVSGVLGSVLGVPKSVWLVALLFLLWFWLRPTRLIRDLTVIGSDTDRARLLGVQVTRRKVQAYAMSAALAALASIYLTAQTASGSPDGGDQFILSSVAAVVLGGTSIFGGKGSAASSIAGAVTFLMIPDLVFALNLASFWSIFLQGLILVLAVMFNSVVQMRARRAP